MRFFFDCYNFIVTHTDTLHLTIILIVTFYTAKHKKIAKSTTKQSNQKNIVYNLAFETRVFIF